MATIKDEIAAIAAEQGYEGDAPQTIAQAVNALGTVMGGGSGGGGSAHVMSGFNGTFAAPGVMYCIEGTGEEWADSLHFTTDSKIFDGNYFPRIAISFNDDGTAWNEPSFKGNLDNWLAYIQLIDKDQYGGYYADAGAASRQNLWGNSQQYCALFSHISHGFAVYSYDGRFWLINTAKYATTEEAAIESLKTYLRDNIGYIQVCIINKYLAQALTVISS